jgi:hypothetical protein
MEICKVVFLIFNLKALYYCTWKSGLLFRFWLDSHRIETILHVSGTVLVNIMKVCFLLLFKGFSVF